MQQIETRITPELTTARWTALNLQIERGVKHLQEGKSLPLQIVDRTREGLKSVKAVIKRIPETNSSSLEIKQPNNVAQLALILHLATFEHVLAQQAGVQDTHISWNEELVDTPNPQLNLRLFVEPGVKHFAIINKEVFEANNLDLGFLAQAYSQWLREAYQSTQLGFPTYAILGSAQRKLKKTLGDEAVVFKRFVQGEDPTTEHEVSLTEAQQVQKIDSEWLTAHLLSPQPQKDAVQ